MLPAAVKRAVEIFAKHIEDPVNVVDVAQIVGMSPRHLERSFKAATGQSPSHYYRTMRMNAARQLVLYTNNSMSQIAQAVGYAGSAPMVQRYREAFGTTPLQDRKTINMFRVENNRSIPS